MQTIEGIETELNLHDHQISILLDILDIQKTESEDRDRDLQQMMSKHLKIMSGLLEKQGELVDRLIALEKEKVK